jgi:hypothetical protein
MNQSMLSMREDYPEDEFVADFLTVSAELCDDDNISAELCEFDDFTPYVYPVSARATFTNDNTLGTEFFDILDDLFADDFAAVGVVDVYTSPVTIPPEEAIDSALAGLCVRVEVADKGDDPNEKVIFASAVAEPTPHGPKETLSRSQVAHDKKLVEKKSDHEKKLTHHLAPKVLSVEEKRQNRLKAISTWLRKRERAAQQALMPAEPVRNARKEAAARRVRFNGKFLKQPPGSTSVITETIDDFNNRYPATHQHFQKPFDHGGHGYPLKFHASP